MRGIKLKQLGDSAVGLVITGRRTNWEPPHVRIEYPWGHVEVTRSNEDHDDPDYWLHVYVNHPHAGHLLPGETRLGKITDARLDIHGKNSANVRLGDFKNSNLYHLALRVSGDGVAKPLKSISNH